MNRSMLLLVALMSCLCGCQTNNNARPDDRTPAPSAQSNADVQRTADSLCHQHCQALLKNDLTALDELWANDLSFINPRGQRLNKAQRLENLRTGATAFKSIDVSELLSRPLAPDAAVSTCRVAINGQYAGQEGSGDYRVTFAWGREDGSWKLKALQMTRVEK